MNDITQFMASMDGAQIPGGCENCDAYQTMTAKDGYTQIGVHHDDWCPTYLSMLNRADRRAARRHRHG